MEEKDKSLIPKGEYCYRVREIKAGEILSTDIEHFGKDLREYSFGGGLKEVLCPYWERTDYGTVRCNFLGLEVLDDDESEARKMVIAHFGDDRAPSMFGSSWALPDEIKVCGVREDEDPDWDNFV